MIVAAGAGHVAGGDRDRHQAEHGYAHKDLHGRIPLSLTRVIKDAVNPVHRDPTAASVARTLLLLPEGLDVAGGSHASDANQDRQGNQGRYDGLHGSYSSPECDADNPMLSIIAATDGCPSPAVEMRLFNEAFLSRIGQSRVSGFSTLATLSPAKELSRYPAGPALAPFLLFAFCPSSATKWVSPRS
jgi:hypothetical protein